MEHRVGHQLIHTRSFPGGYAGYFTAEQIRSYDDTNTDHFSQYLKHFSVLRFRENYSLFLIINKQTFETLTPLNMTNQPGPSMMNRMPMIHPHTGIKYRWLCCQPCRTGGFESNFDLLHIFPLTGHLCHT